MKKITFILLVFLKSSFCGFGQKDNRIELSTKSATLQLENNVLTINQIGSAGINIITPLDQLFKLTIQNKKESTVLAPKLYEVQSGKDFKVSLTGGKITILSQGSSIDTKAVPITITLTIWVNEDQFHFSGAVESFSEDWMPRELIYPNFDRVAMRGEEPSIFWPSALGEKFSNPALFGNKTFSYPSGTGTMQWYTITNSTCGLYIATHDSLQGKKSFSLSYDSLRKTFNAAIRFPLYALKTQLPPIIVAPYEGSWHLAASKYRAWYNRHFRPAKAPHWVNEDAGWMLAILKQQNGHVLFNYKDIDQLCTAALQLNLTTIGLFGWAAGGHDYQYPNYIPDDLMGGRKALEEAINRAHRRGLKIVLYANGSIMDVSTEFYRYNGNETMAIKEDKSPYIESYRKYNSSPPVVFVKGSPSSKLWRKTMLDLALQAHMLGADGILYDQIGVISSELNFSTLQDHKLPQDAFTKYRYQMMHEIRTELKKLDSNFVVMTEAINDGVLPDIDYVHGWGPGTVVTPNAFPELFRYTFPELIETQRNSSPMIPKWEANYATLYGLRHEIEVRYDADKNYLLHGDIPNSESYLDEAYYTPDPAKIKEVTYQEAMSYTRNLLQFEKKNARFLRAGQFVDQDGFTIKGNNIVAKGFRAGNELGILIWNTSITQSESYVLTVPGYERIKIEDISNTNVTYSSPLKQNSLRLVTYKKL